MATVNMTLEEIMAIPEETIVQEMADVSAKSQLIYNGSSEPPGYSIEKHHNIGACYWIMPVKVKDMSKLSTDMDNLEILAEEEISIDQSTFEKLLYPIFKQHFDNELPENVGRGVEYSLARYDDGIAFDRDLSENFYFFEQIEKILADIKQYADIDKGKYTAEELGFYKDFESSIRKMMNAGAAKGYKILSIGSP